VGDYYRLKAKQLKVDRLYDYDRYAPLGKNEQKIDYATACQNVLEAFETFSPKCAEVARKAISEGWIDSHPKVNKRGGAFSHGTTPFAHPYILLNFTDKRRDAFTLAHELGHTIHQEFSKSVGYLNANTPLTTAETASIFAEMLLFDKLKQTLSGEELIGLYAGKIEDIFATLFRQIVFTNFERRVHAHEGELKSAEYATIWMEENKKMFGKSVTLRADYALWWSYIPHFVHSPFYCYAYSYGQLLVLALFGLYKSGFDGFTKRYERFLSLGGSQSPKELIESFGFDIEGEAFWAIGIKEVHKLLVEFKEVIECSKR